jgi:large subunit ribosomal protein L24
MKIKKDDNVIITSGKDKGKTGKVVHALPREDRVVVEGVNIRKVHQKPRQTGQKGQIVEITMPVNVSNVALIDPKTKKATRIGFSFDEKGKKTRITKASGTKV